MDFQQATAQALLNKGVVDRANLRGQGYPDKMDQVETNYWEYFDTLAYPSQALGLISEQNDLFTNQIQSGLARNLSLPTTSDLAFFNYRILAFLMVDLEADTQSAPMIPVDGQSLLNAARIIAQSTRINVEVALKSYLNTTLDHWTNFQIPVIVDSLQGQVAPAPFAISGGTFQQHHRVSLAVDPGIIWPANGNVKITISTNTAGWGRDTYGASPVITDNPWKIIVKPTFKFVFIGSQARVVK